MTKDQKTVAIGASFGIISMIVLVWLLSEAISAPAIPDTPGDRLAYALPWAVVAVLPFFAMIIAVGNARFLSEAIDPTAGKEDQQIVINGRVAENTLQQYVFFLAALLALAVMLPADRLSFVPAVAITFFIARIVFWIGYRIHPLYRAPGFSSTAYMNIFMFIAVLWMWIS